MSSVTDRGIYGASADELQSAFRTGEFPVAVYGLGKMGLPLASVFAEVSGDVIGADVDPDVVVTVNNRESHVKREPGLNPLVGEMVAKDRLRATTDTLGAAEEATVHVVIVPTTITNEKSPDLSILDAVVADIGEGLDPGDLVVVECTVPPRTTEDRVTPQLAGASGLDRGEFGVAFCPERTSSGRALKDIRGAYPKVVGGVDDASTRTARLIYEEINDSGVIEVTDATTAECVKVFEGLYRDVNIALANELATFTDEFGVDVREAIEVANTQPYCDIHDPGPGVGGHCIPFYPYFVIKPFETPAPLLETAREINDSMPQFTVEKLREEFAAEGWTIAETSVLILGLTYRPGVAEIRASPSITIVEELNAMGVDVYAVDPILEDVNPSEFERIELPDIYEYEFEGIIVVTPHKEFDDIDWSHLGRDDGSVIINGRQSVTLPETPHRLYTIGVGGKISNKRWNHDG